MSSDFTAESRRAQRNNNIHVLPHVAARPVSVEREHPDVLVIEGVRFSGNFFRELALPNPDYLYAIKRDVDGVVILTTISNVEGAQDFFAEVNGG